MHQVILMKNGKKQDITRMIGNLAWSSNTDALGEELSFETAYNDSAYFKSLDTVKPGDQLALMNGSRFLNYFIVVTSTSGGRFGKSFACFDRSWYLNKNETVIQFKKASASQAISKLLDKFGVKHNIAKIPTLITKIYKDQTISDIIKDILDQVQQETKTKYRIEMVKDVLTIHKQKDMLINPMIRITSNTPAVPATKTLSNPNRQLSIDEMKNTVIVVSEGDDSAKIFAKATSKSSVSKYGQLTEVVTLDSKNAAQARNIAANTLADLNKVAETVTFDMLGHDDIRAGRLIKVNEPVTGIIGTYLIKTANHTEQKGIHRVSMELEAHDG